MSETGNRHSARGRGADIAERLLEFAVAVIRLTGQLPKDASGRHVGLQVLRSSTSAGANYEEARAAESRADFVHKLGIAAKEVRETVFWLSLIQRCRWTTVDLEPVLREADQLAAILRASIRTARSRSD
jgi:four helix bundle protein